MAVRPSVFFQFNYAEQGWTERYWYTNTSASLSIVAGAATSLLVLRSKMLAKGPRIVNAFCSYEDVFRDYFPVPIPPQNSDGTYNTAITIGAAKANDTVVGRGFSGDRAGKDVFFSGIPYSATLGGNLYNFDDILSQAFKDAWDAFTNGLINGWGWKGITYDPALAPIANVLDMVPAADTWTVAVNTVVGFDKGKKVKLTEAVFTGSATNRGNRVYRIKEVGPGNVLTLDWGSANLDGLVYQTGGKLQIQNYVVWPFTGLKREKLGTHKRGVSIVRQVGRRRTQ